MSAIRFRTEDGLLLEGELRHPDDDPVGTAVVCHPHPKHGGSKDHPLLWAIRNDLAGKRGFVALAFNFRGVMGSEGEHGEGVEETKDLAAAIARVREEAPGPTVVAAWSFGANVALRQALADERISALAVVGIPLADATSSVPPLPDSFEGFETPVLVVAGSDDPFCPEPEALRLVGRLPQGEAHLIPGTGHFLPGHERAAAEAIGAFVARIAHSGAEV